MAEPSAAPAAPALSHGGAVAAGAAPSAPLRDRARRFGPVVAVAVGWLVVLVVLSAAAGLLPLADPDASDLDNRLAPPLSPGHLLGTDGLGRDTLARIAHGGRATLAVAAVAVVSAAVVGGGLGVVAGFRGGVVDAVVAWLTNVVLAYPGLVLLLGVVALSDGDSRAITGGVAVLALPAFVRVARAATLACTRQDYVLAARVVGAGQWRILRVEVIPQVVWPVVAFGLVVMAVVVVLETSLAFLGLSVAGPTWGEMIAQGRPHMSSTLHPVLVPSVVIFLTLVSLNLVGDALRARFDARAV